MTDSHEAGGAELRPLVATLDGPSGVSFHRPSAPPEAFASHGVPAEPWPDAIRIFPFGSDTPELVIPLGPTTAELDAEPDPACVAAAARVRAAFAEPSEPSPEPHRSTPALYPAEPGRR